MSALVRAFNARPAGPGRVPLWDPKNEQYGVGAVFPRSARKDPRPHYPRFRQWRYFNQGATSRCTAFASMTLRDCASVRDPALYRGQSAEDLDDHGDDLYRAIQHVDRSRHGLDFGYDGGATMLAALKVGVARGWWGEYRWCLKFEEVAQVLRLEPLLIGVNWYTSMYRRTSEGIVRITPAARLDGGHAIVVNHYDAKRGLYRCPNTWGDGDYWIPAEDMHRLFDEQGEFAVVRERPAPAAA